jgi:integrase
MNLINNSEDNIESLYNRYMESIAKNNFTEGTIDNYKYMKSLIIQFNEKNKVDVNKIDEKLIFTLKEYFYERGIKDNTQILYLHRVKKFIKYLIKNNLIKNNFIEWENIFKNLKRFKEEEETISNEELSFLIDKRNTEKQYIKVLDIFLFSIFTGLRYGDIKTMCKDEIINFFIDKITQKTKAEVYIGLNDLTTEILEKYNYNLNLFDLSYYNRALKLMLKDFSKEMKSFGKQLIVKRRVKGKLMEYKKYRYDRFASHSGRRSFITINIDNNTPLNLIALNTGHKKMDILLGYLNKRQDVRTNLSNNMLTNLNNNTLKINNQC